MKKTIECINTIVDNEHLFLSINEDALFLNHVKKNKHFIEELDDITKIKFINLIFIYHPSYINIFEHSDLICYLDNLEFDFTNNNWAINIYSVSYGVNVETFLETVNSVLFNDFFFWISEKLKQNPIEKNVLFAFLSNDIFNIEDLDITIFDDILDEDLNSLLKKSTLGIDTVLFNIILKRLAKNKDITKGCLPINFINLSFSNKDIFVKDDIIFNFEKHMVYLKSKMLELIDKKKLIKFDEEKRLLHSLIRFDHLNPDFFEEMLIEITKKKTGILNRDSVLEVDIKNGLERNSFFTKYYDFFYRLGIDFVLANKSCFFKKKNKKEFLLEKLNLKESSSLLDWKKSFKNDRKKTLTDVFNEIEITEKIKLLNIRPSAFNLFRSTSVITSKTTSDCDSENCYIEFIKLLDKNLKLSEADNDFLELKYSN